MVLFFWCLSTEPRNVQLRLNSGLVNSGQVAGKATNPFRSKLSYNARMTTSIPPKSQQFLMPRDPKAVGPQNDSERRLFELIKEGLDDGVVHETTIDELTAELRKRIQKKR